MANVQFRDVVKKYAGTDEALGVPAGTVGGIPVVTPDDLGPAAAMTPAEVVTDEDAQAALSATFAPVGAAVQAAQGLLGRMKREDADASIVVLSDSTANETSEWPGLITQELAAAYPAWTVQRRVWDDGTGQYGTATTVQTGTGARTLTVYVGAVAGWHVNHVLKVAPTIVGAIRPDLCFISIGHNETTVNSDFRERYLTLTEEVRALCPATPLICIAQNPSRANTDQAGRATAIGHVCAARGYGFIDVHQVFLDYGDWQTDLMNDNSHPNSAGQQLWADEVMKHLVYVPGASPGSQQPSSLVSGFENLVSNPTFAEFDSTFDGWSLTNATAEKDETHFETGSWGCRVQSSGSSAASIYQDLPIALCRGRWITAAVRVRRNGAGVSGNQGRVNLQVTGTGALTTSSRASNVIDQQFYWVVLSAYVDPGASNVRLRLYADSSTSGAGDVTFDRACVVRGLLPADVPGYQLVP